MRRNEKYYRLSYNITRKTGPGGVKTRVRARKRELENLTPLSPGGEGGGGGGGGERKTWEGAHMQGSGASGKPEGGTPFLTSVRDLLSYDSHGR